MNEHSSSQLPPSPGSRGALKVPAIVPPWFLALIPARTTHLPLAEKAGSFCLMIPPLTSWCHPGPLAPLSCPLSAEWHARDVAFAARGLGSTATRPPLSYAFLICKTGIMLPALQVIVWETGFYVPVALQLQSPVQMFWHRPCIILSHLLLLIMVAGCI